MIKVEIIEEKVKELVRCYKYILEKLKEKEPDNKEKAGHAFGIQNGLEYGLRHIHNPSFLEEIIYKQKEVYKTSENKYNLGRIEGMYTVFSLIQNNHNVWFWADALIATFRSRKK